MTIQEIQRLRSAQPFEPFRIVTADGRSYDVRHPEYLGQTPSGRLITIGLDDDSTVTLDLLRVTGVQKPLPKAGKRRKSA
jgi:Tfp pilus assembly protein PilP